MALEQRDFDAEVGRLLKALTLSQGFHFYIGTCDEDSIADRVVTAIDGQLPTLRGEAVHVRRTAPRFSGTMRTPADRQVLVERVLAAVLAPPAEDATRALVHVVDATVARPSELDDWRLVFQRLNEARNVIARSLQGEFVLLLLPSMDQSFNELAPDLLSIHSGAEFVFSTPPRVSMPVVAQVSRVATPDIPSDPVALRTSALDAIRRADEALHHKELTSAAPAIEQALSYTRAWLQKLPKDQDAARSLIAVMTLESMASERRGDVAAAYERARDAETEARVRAMSPWAVLPMTQTVFLAERVAVLNTALDRRSDAASAWKRAWDDSASLDATARFALGLRLLDGLRRLGATAEAGRHAEFVRTIAESLGPAARDQFYAATMAGRSGPTPEESHAVLLEPLPPGAAYQRAWYVDRPTPERAARRCLAGPGTPLAILGPTATGKTWLAERLMDDLRQQPGARVARIDLAASDGAVPASFVSFADGLVTVIGRSLGVDSEAEALRRNTRLTPALRVTETVEAGLHAATGTVCVVLDVPDSLLTWAGWQDVEGILRSWNDRSSEDPWQRLRIVLLYSTSPVLARASPFRVTPVLLGDFDPSEREALAARYGVHWTKEEWARVPTRIGGHPLLLSAVLYAVRMEGLELAAASNVSTNRELAHAIKLIRGDSPG